MLSRRDHIVALVDEGRSVREVATTLGLAPNTVRYHLARAGSPSGEVSGAAVSMGSRTRPVGGAATGAAASASGSAESPGRVEVTTRAAVARLLEEGVPRVEIARRLGIARSTVAYHARRLGAGVDTRFARRYDWAEVQRFYDTGRTAAECRAHFGFSTQSWHEAVRRGAIVARPAGMPLADLCVAGVPRNRGNLKRRLLREGVKAERCEACGISSWMGVPLSMALHHRNGDSLDNRLENLELLCPNCHSQTENFAGRRRPATGHG